MELQQIYSLIIKSAGICTDTRTLKKGEIFFALKGPNHDGNLHAYDAIKAGAVASVVDKPGISGTEIINVNDVFTTLNQLAELHRKSITVPVLAITGTNGKTTTKELIKTVLSKKYKVHATEGNLNNHLGVPLTLLKTPADAGILVIEMGASHPGEIAALCEVAKPTHGIITNIGRAHLEGFGSFEGVVEAKSELYHYLRNTGGIAIYNEKDGILNDLIFKIVHKAVPYSDPSGTDMVVEAADDDVYLKVRVQFHGAVNEFSTSLFGKHNLDNVRAAMATGTFFDVPVAGIIDAVSSYKPGNNRSQIRATGKNTVICDSYNANPSSMLKALTSFSEMKCSQKMVIIGDMFELGDEGLIEHARILDEISKLDVGEVVLCGQLFSQVKQELPFKRFKDAPALRNWLQSLNPEGRTILVKGSRGMELDKLYDLL